MPFNGDLVDPHFELLSVIKWHSQTNRITRIDDLLTTFSACLQLQALRQSSTRWIDC